MANARRWCAWSTLILATAGVSAHAACPPPLHVSPVIRVGDMASDAACNYDSIQDAINAAGTDPTCPTVIAITREHIWSHQNLSVANRSIRFVGQGDGVTCAAAETCDSVYSSCPTSADATLSASGSGRVLTITGTSNVELDGLAITGGSVDGDGGGINFTGAGKLVINASTIVNNAAGYGAGVDVNGSGGAASVVIGPNTVIELNTASNSGGGIRIEGAVRLFMLATNSPVLLNEATNGYGGGIEVIGPARADLGATGIGGGAAIASNTAKYGAGIAVLDNGNGEGVVRSFAHDATTPFVIDNNTGADAGGGLYVSGVAAACLYGTRLSDNGAADGAAVYQVGAQGHGVYVNDTPMRPLQLGIECGPEPIADLGGSNACTVEDCSTFRGNATTDANGNPTPGATVAGHEFFATRFRMRHNLAARLFYVSEGDLDIRRCLLVDNNLSQAVAYTSAGLARIKACTIANNVIDQDVVFDSHLFGSDFDFSYSIVSQSSSTVVVDWYSPGATFTVDYVMANGGSGLPTNNPSVVAGLAYFVDPQNGDYHLSAAPQLALDFGGAATDAGFPDLDGNAAVADLAAFPNYLPGNAVDLGAYERQSAFACGTADSIYCNGFEH